MAAIIFVHGIDNEQLTPDGIQAEWLLALAGGVRLAGRSDLGDRLRSGAIESRAAYYGDLFRAEDQMGGSTDFGDLSSAQANFGIKLAEEWLERIARNSPATSRDAAEARFALDVLRKPEETQTQGIRNIERHILSSLARYSWLAPLGMTFAERFVVTALKQVTLYLTDETIRSRAQQTVLDLIDEDTRLIIGHSLGSVVAYECAHRLSQSLPLLVTLGSPLGLRTIVKDRLRPPASFPARVDHWLNAADLDDVVATEPELRPDFAREMPQKSRLDCILVDNGSSPHNPIYYLGKARIGRVISEALV